MYFENKYKEQNHKITSMLSLVSSLAEEMNVLRYNVSHSFSGGGNANFCVAPERKNSELIDVSDDEDEEYDDDEDDDDDDEDDDDDDEDGDADDDEDDDDDDKKTVFMGKISISDDDNSLEEFDTEDLSDIKTNNLVKVLNIGRENTLTQDEFIYNDIQDLDNEIKFVEKKNIVEIKKEGNTMIIDEQMNLEETTTDYKKMTMQKLKSLVVEKGLTVDPSKLKKQEIVKLLENHT